MNFKRAFFAATAAIMLPGLAMAATFETVVYIVPDTGDSVTVNFQCNAGDNLTDSFSLGADDTVTFTNNIPEGVTADCSITASDEPAGYINVAAPCTFTDVVDTDELNCAFAYEPAGFEFEVEYEVDEAAEATDGSASYQVACGPLRDGYTYTQYHGFYFDQDGDTYTFSFGAPAEPATDEDPSTVCTVSATSVNPSEVEVSSCTDTVEFGDDTGGCTISATVFFEGIPTLSQYGMAVMVLLMLGVGFVGFRRFV